MYSLAKKFSQTPGGHVPTCPLAGDATANTTSTTPQKADVTLHQATTDYLATAELEYHRPVFGLLAAEHACEQFDTTRHDSSVSPRLSVPRTKHNAYE